jgi:hypothetical protein
MDEERRRREEAERERDDLRRELFACTAEEHQGRDQPHSSDAPSVQEGVQRRSWWRRMFGR